MKLSDSPSIRPYHPEDASTLVKIYSDSVHNLGSQAYSPSQVKHWAGYADSPDFISGLSEGLTLVAETDHKPVGFAQLKPLDHVHLVYVLSEYSRQGIATALVRKLLEFADSTGQKKITAYASLLSRSLFEKLDFHVVEEETGFYHGLAFSRFVMERHTPGTGP